MRELLTRIGYVWIAAWAALFLSAGFTNLFGILHPWPALDNLGWFAFNDWRVLVLWAALIPGLALVGVLGSNSN